MLAWVGRFLYMRPLHLTRSKAYSRCKPFNMGKKRNQLQASTFTRTSRNLVSNRRSSTFIVSRVITNGAITCGCQNCFISTKSFFTHSSLVFLPVSLSLTPLTTKLFYVLKHNHHYSFSPHDQTTAICFVLPHL